MTDQLVISSQLPGSVTQVVQEGGAGKILGEILRNISGTCEARIASG